MFGVFKRIRALLTDRQRRDLCQPDIKGSKFIDIWTEVWNSNPVAVNAEFELTIHDVRLVLDDTVLVLSEVVKNTAIATDAGPEFLRNIIRRHREDNTFSISRDMFARFVFAIFTRKRRQLIERLKENIDSLKQLVGLEDLRKELAPDRTATFHRPYLDKVRTYSDSLYHALHNIWQCACHNSPSARLRDLRLGIGRTTRIDGWRGVI